MQWTNGRHNSENSLYLTSKEQRRLVVCGSRLCPRLAMITIYIFATSRCEERGTVEESSFIRQGAIVIIIITRRRIRRARRLMRINYSPAINNCPCARRRTCINDATSSATVAYTRSVIFTVFSLPHFYEGKSYLRDATI